MENPNKKISYQFTPFLLRRHGEFMALIGKNMDLRSAARPLQGRFDPAGSISIP